MTGPVHFPTAGARAALQELAGGARELAPGSLRSLAIGLTQYQPRLDRLRVGTDTLVLEPDALVLTPQNVVVVPVVERYMESIAAAGCPPNGVIVTEHRGFLYHLDGLHRLVAARLLDMDAIAQLCRKTP